ncbi:hypothetical protein [Saccharopolyspora gloriosae]|uniref:hypothetical protein n=1 Tax=Saccharopolyspora gloriosae TaxID=455344 RepID=UPI001FB85F76|nr:hypothetical protein [Saccharopolyspora gloriosae]
MSNTMRRVAASLVTVVAAGTLSLAVVAPAQATGSDCTTYLKARGYLVGPKVNAACKRGSSGGLGQIICQNNLIAIQVSASHAQHACKLAAVK